MGVGRPWLNFLWVDFCSVNSGALGNQADSEHCVSPGLQVRGPGQAGWWPVAGGGAYLELGGPGLGVLSASSRLLVLELSLQPSPSLRPIPEALGTGLPAVASGGVWKQRPGLGPSRLTRVAGRVKGHREQPIARSWTHSIVCPLSSGADGSTQTPRGAR